MQRLRLLITLSRALGAYGLLIEGNKPREGMEQNLSCASARKHAHDYIQLFTRLCSAFEYTNACNTVKAARIHRAQVVVGSFMPQGFSTREKRKKLKHCSVRQVQLVCVHTGVQDLCLQRISASLQRL